MRRWEEYIRKLFADNRAKVNMKNGKATGPDELPVEIIKLIEDQNLQPLLDLFNDIYKTGEIPRELLKSTFVTLPKKNNAKVCAEYRIIKALEGETAGIIITETPINNIRYADDEGLLPDKISDLQRMMEQLDTVSESYYT
ncbi:hypothetical protein ILUMI_22471 [Ignelater luminosus]|uniref:Reverse transcriptase n=1 Tax=Ignelater luminosus TaxID=2038154 RepID=A0A8K0CAL3_IGNLU|nr:hypothetical protein ILUMI_22471 [Ignelater luminosus]